MNNGVDPYIDWKDWRDDSFGRFDPLLARYFEAETGIGAEPGVRVLEVGFGNGPLIGWCHNIGVEIFGVELSPALVDRCRLLLGEGRAFTDLYDARLTAAAGNFTHIVAFDVIEHISQGDLLHFLTRLKSLLAAGGHIILRFPNGDSPFGRIHQHGDPTHVTTIGRSKISYFAQQTGLAVQDIRAPRLPVTGTSIGRAIKRRLVSAGRYCVERMVGILYFGGQAIPLDPNYIAVLVHVDPRQPTPPE
jgi:2-polyprenyl-3-methyl-5-hydroxy-6-metoxy-1,4-benzoquinol methylase